jgi:hypothetical protein
MEMVAVKSSNVKSVGYDSSSKILVIEFFGGGVYQYFEVPADVHADFMEAPSKGKFFSQHIKNYFKYAKVPQINIVEIGGVKSVNLGVKVEP